jgi:carboxylesterase type B
VDLSNEMTKHWAQFIKIGNPNGPGLPTWPRFTIDRHLNLRLIPPSGVVESTYDIAGACTAS